MNLTTKLAALAAVLDGPLAAFTPEQSKDWTVTISKEATFSTIGGPEKWGHISLSVGSRTFAAVLSALCYTEPVNVHHGEHQISARAVIVLAAIDSTTGEPLTVYLRVSCSEYRKLANKNTSSDGSIADALAALASARASLGGAP